MASADLELILDQLDAARRDVLVTVEPLDDALWRTPRSSNRPDRLGTGWDPAAIVGYLAWGDFAALLAATDPFAWKALLTEAGSSPDAYINAHAVRWGARDRAELLSQLEERGAALAKALKSKPATARFEWFDGYGYTPIEVASMRLDTYRRSLVRFPVAS